MTRSLIIGLTLLFLAVDAAMLHAADDELLFSDNFTTLKPGWGEASEGKHVDGNRLLVDLTPDSAFHRVYEGDKFTNADIRLKMTLVKGQMDQPAGIA
jgi:hypothetical protein